MLNLHCSSEKIIVWYFYAFESASRMIPLFHIAQGQMPTKPWGVLEKIVKCFTRNTEFDHNLITDSVSLLLSQRYFQSKLSCLFWVKWFTVSVTVSWSHLPLLESCLLKASLIQAHLTSDGHCPWPCHYYDGVVSSACKVSFGRLHFSSSTDIQADNGSGACYASSNIYCKGFSVWLLHCETIRQ